MVAEVLSDRATKVPSFVKINFSQTLSSSASATVTLVTPASGKRVVVVSLGHIALGTIPSNTKIKFLSDTTDITGQLTSNVASLTQNGSINSGYMPDGHFWTAAGEALKMTVTNASGVSRVCLVDGFITYYEE